MDRMEAKNTGNNLISTTTFQHPLQVVVIIRTLLEFLHLQRIKTLRLVCQTWNKECVNILRKKGRFSIDVSNQDDFAKLHVINSSNNLTCHHFTINLQNAIQWTLLGNLEKSIVELDLYLCRDLKIYGNFPDALGSFSNLKTLCFRQFSEEATSVSNNLPFLQTILERAPLLNKVELETGRCNVLHLFINLLNVAKPCHKITSLSLIGHIEDSHITQLSRLGLKLHHLKLSFSHVAPNNSENSVHTLLTGLADTLENLEIGYNLGLEMYETLLEFPQLCKLTSLGVTVTGEDDEGILYISKFSYSEKLPNLKKLSLDCNSGDIQQFWKPSTSVEELVIDYVVIEELESKPEDLESFSADWSMFPNVKNLSISCFTADLQSFLNVITKTWPNLEKLKFRLYPSDIDQAILGLGRQEYQVLLEYFISGEDFANLETKYQSMDKQSTLCSLKRLATLEFGPYESSEASEVRPLLSSEAWKFSDLSCRLVLLKMDCLEKIVFHDMFCIDQISEHVRCQMQRHFKRWC